MNETRHLFGVAPGAFCVFAIWGAEDPSYPKPKFWFKLKDYPKDTDRVQLGSATQIAAKYERVSKRQRISYHGSLGL